MLIIRAYLFIVIATMISEMWVVARADIIGLPRNQCQTLCTIVVSFLPLGNIIALIGNIMMIFMKRKDFIINYLYNKLGADEVKIEEIEKDEEE